MLKFTKRGRHCLYYAQANAGIVGPKQIMPCHIFLALMQDSGSVAERVMTAAGITANDVLRQIQASYPRPTSEDDNSGYADESGYVFHYSSEEAKKMETAFIGTEHLLLGVLRVPDLAIRPMMEEKGIAVDAVRDQIIAMLREGVTADAPETEDENVNSTPYYHHDHQKKRTAPKKNWWYKVTGWMMQLIGIPLYTPPNRLPEEIHAKNSTVATDLFDATIASISLLLADSPEHPLAADLYGTRGTTHGWLGHYDASIADLTMAIQLKPEQHGYYIDRIIFHDLEGRLDLALQECNAVISADPENKKALYFRAIIHAEQRKFAEARADLEAAFKNAKEDIEYAVGLAELAYYEGAYATATKHFRYAIDVLPDKHTISLAMLYWQYAKALDALGDTKGAMTAFETALDAWDVPSLKRPLQWLQEMRDYMKQHQ